MSASNDNVDCVECKAAEEEAPVAAPAAAEKQSAAEDVLDPSTFTPPTLSAGPVITIEYCDRCRWAPRASWVATELFLTFPSPAIASITLMPSVENAGRFRIWMKLPGQTEKLVADRKIDGGFPELKVLKQKIRDILQPEKSLGHSDKPGTKVLTSS